MDAGKNCTLKNQTAGRKRRKDWHKNADELKKEYTHPLVMKLKFSRLEMIPTELAGCGISA